MFRSRVGKNILQLAPHTPLLCICCIQCAIYRINSQNVRISCGSKKRGGSQVLGVWTLMPTCLATEVSASVGKVVGEVVGKGLGKGGNHLGCFLLSHHPSSSCCQLPIAAALNWKCKLLQWATLGGGGANDMVGIIGGVIPSSAIHCWRISARNVWLCPSLLEDNVVLYHNAWAANH